MTARVWGMVIAAGSGRRFGRFKQFEPLGAIRLVDHSVAALMLHCERVVVVIPPGVAWDGDTAVVAVPGGATRLDSVRAALAAIPTAVERIVIHDPAHPLASAALVGRLLAALQEPDVDAAIPAGTVTDSLKRVVDGWVVDSVDKTGLVANQLPHAYRAEVLRAAHAGAPEGIEDCQLVERLGGRIVTVTGEPWNLHVTTIEEFEMVRALHAAGFPPRMQPE